MSNSSDPLEPENTQAADAPAEPAQADAQPLDDSEPVDDSEPLDDCGPVVRDAAGKRSGSLVERAEIAWMVAWVAVALSLIGAISTIRIWSVPSGSAGSDPPQFRTDINTAPAAELALLPGIGPELATRIVAEREAGGPFKSAEQLGRVRGIGPAKIEQVAPLLRFDDSSTSAMVHDHRERMPPP